MARVSGSRSIDRREFLNLGARRGTALTILGGSLPALLAACGEDTPTPTGRPGKGAGEEVEGTPIVGDVVDFALTSTEWQGPFGFVTFKLHKGAVDGKDVFYIRTDTSDSAFGQTEGLVVAPNIKRLIKPQLVGSAYLVEEGVTDQPVVLTSEPGRDDYTPAWRVHRARWTAEPSLLRSESDVREHEGLGHIEVKATRIVMNGPIVKWSQGEMPVDEDRMDYLGGGQLLEAPDTKSMQVMFKLHECFPGVRYIVCDTSMEPMAEGMNIAFSPRLAGTNGAKATGRTNVFMNGIEGPGPMGFQPSVFDSQAGDEEWSPYWDHMTYAWNKGAKARVLDSEEQVHAARDKGQLEEFPGTPDTKGEIFTVNCPVPVLAPNTFKA